MRDFLTVVEVLTIHADQLRRYGGATGVRDAGLLEAALYRAQSGYYEDLIQEAAALWESLSQNHPFVDGNKRTAFASMDVFLRINGMRLLVSSESAWVHISALYDTGNFRFTELEAWLRQHVRPTSSR